MEQVSHALGWFEIPANNFDRAKAFYNRIFDFDMPEVPIEGGRMGIFLYDMAGGGVGGGLVQLEGWNPSTTHGSIVYLNGGKDLSVVLDRVVAAGGLVTKGKTAIPGMGNYAFFTDTEGNRVGLFSAD